MYRIVNICKKRVVRQRRNRHRKKVRGNVDDSKLCEFKNDLLRLNGDCSSRIENFILSKSRLFLERFVKSTYSGEIGHNLSYIVNSCVEFFRKPRPCKKDWPEMSCNIDFSHKILGDVNLPSIINSSNVKNSLPSCLRDQFHVRFVYKYGKTIGGKILNYNYILRDSGVSCFDDIERMSCDCDTSPFKNEHFGISSNNFADGIQILHVHDHGVACKWNYDVTKAGFPQDCLKVNDIIISVNGIRGCGQMLKNEITLASELFLVIKRLDRGITS